MEENNNDKKKAAAGKPLTEEQITSTRVDRRTMMRTAGLAGLGAGALGVSGCVAVAVPGGVGVAAGPTDSDNGPITDPLGNGRGQPHGVFVGFSDADNGPIFDPGGQGRG